VQRRAQRPLTLLKKSPSWSNMCAGLFCMESPLLTPRLQMPYIVMFLVVQFIMSKFMPQEQGRGEAAAAAPAQ
jgi:hypothetical protein